MPTPNYFSDLGKKPRLTAAREDQSILDLQMAADRSACRTNRIIGLTSILSAALTGYCICFVLFYYILPGLQHRHHQAFATCGKQKIAIANEIEELFGPASCFVTYSPDGPLWNSHLFLYERYELTMQVHVEIESATDGAVTGKAQFFLNEISTININKSVVASFSSNWTFGDEEWRKLYEDHGDFSAIGIKLNKNSPVKNIGMYISKSR